MNGLLEYLTQDIPRSARENLPNAVNRGMVAGLLGGPVDIANIALGRSEAFSSYGESPKVARKRASKRKKP